MSGVKKMNKRRNEILYSTLVQDILDNDEFNKEKIIVHHGTTRYKHSVKVSYYSYNVAKMLRLDYKAAARAGLLHDFFLDTYTKTNKTSLLYDHPLIAIDNSKKYFELNDKEEDIIKCHMFPVTPYIPKYAESWIVTLMDKTVALEEYAYKFKYKIAYAANLYLIFLFNFME